MVFIPMVSSHDNGHSFPSTRPVHSTLRAAKDAMDNETGAKLGWADFFGGAVATRNGLRYEIVKEHFAG